MNMSRADILFASTSIAKRLIAEMKEKRIGRLGADQIRAAVCGYCCGRVLTVGETEQLFDLTLRNVVEECV